MYDEVKIRSVRVKIIPDSSLLGAMSTQISVNTAFDRNGFMRYLYSDGTHGYSGLEDPAFAQVKTYSSCMTKNLL